MFFGGLSWWLIYIKNTCRKFMRSTLTNLLLIIYNKNPSPAVVYLIHQRTDGLAKPCEKTIKIRIKTRWYLNYNSARAKKSWLTQGSNRHTAENKRHVTTGITTTPWELVDRGNILLYNHKWGRALRSRKQGCDRIQYYLGKAPVTGSSEGFLWRAILYAHLCARRE